MVTIVLCKKDTQPSQTSSEGYTFSATALYKGVSLFLGSINWTRLDLMARPDGSPVRGLILPRSGKPRPDFG